MNKNEFLNILRQSLEGEVDNSVIEQSLKFYNEYISSHSDKSEDEILEELGNPRLIAKTIIETENASKQSESMKWNNNDENNSGDPNRRSININGIFNNIKWYHKVAILLIVLLIIYVLIRVGWIIIRLLFTFSVPIIVIVLLWAMFRKR